MGISPSKRVSGSLQNSGEFNSTCNSVFDQFSSLNHQNHDHSTAVVFPYQLLDASNNLHLSLSASIPLVKKWVPDPPPRDQVDRVYRSITARRRQPDDDDGSPPSLRLEQFKAFAVELFASAVVGNAARAVATRVPIGAVGIVGVGLATKAPRRDLIGAAIGAYALGVATSIYISLS